MPTSFDYSMSKLLFFDIDGTIAYPRRAPSLATVDAIRKARENGHKVFISTGRTWDFIPPAVAEIGFDGGIYSSGGIVMLGNTILTQHHMSEQVSNTVLNLLRSKPVFYVLETTAGRFNTENGEDILTQTDMTNLSDDMKRFASAVILDPTSLPISKYEGQPIFKIAYYSPDHSMTEQLTAALDGIAKVVEFDNIPGFPLNMGEISDFSVNKGLAMLDVCRHFGKTAADCIAFGDSMNDVEILTAAGLGIAMGNADEKVKAIADKVCDRCENDGIAKVLRELGLI